MIVSKVSLKNKLMRSLWKLTYCLLFRYTPIFAHKWRILILNLFGARISYSCFVYPDVRIWAPWNLVMEADSTLAFGVICYNPGSIKIGAHSTISQYCHLCCAGHDYEHSDALRSSKFPLLVGEINIGNHVWVTADCFIGPDVMLNDWAVVLPRSVVVKDVARSAVVGGSPAIFVKQRKIRV